MKKSVDTPDWVPPKNDAGGTESFHPEYTIYFSEVICILLWNVIESDELIQLDSDKSGRTIYKVQVSKFLMLLRFVCASKLCDLVHFFWLVHLG